MLLRITQREGTDTTAILRLEGRLDAEVVALVEQECSGPLGRREKVRLDLEGVNFVDLAGVEMLRRLSRAGARILCPPGPVASVLEGAGIRVLSGSGSGKDSVSSRLRDGAEPR